MKDIIFSEVIKNKRKTTGLTAERFAKMIGFNVNTYRGWEHGKHEPSPIVRETVLRRIDNLIKSSVVTLPEDMEIMSREDSARLFSIIDDAKAGNLPDVPFSVIVEALDKFCPPTQYLQIVDYIRGKV